MRFRDSEFLSKILKVFRTFEDFRDVLYLNYINPYESTEKFHESIKGVNLLKRGIYSYGPMYI
jgi:hypothetical protein